MRYLMMTIISSVVISCSNDDQYTLYRNSVIDKNLRIHVASFNTNEGNDYNMENCNVAKELFQSQPAVQTTYWCEKGAFKK